MQQFIFDNIAPSDFKWFESYTNSWMVWPVWPVLLSTVCVTAHPAQTVSDNVQSDSWIGASLSLLTLRAVLRWKSHSVICSWRPGGSADENKVQWTCICRRGSGGMEPVTVLHPQLFICEQFQDSSENIYVLSNIWLYITFLFLHAPYP